MSAAGSKCETCQIYKENCKYYDGIVRRLIEEIKASRHSTLQTSLTRTFNDIGVVGPAQSLESLMRENLKLQHQRTELLNIVTTAVSAGDREVEFLRANVAGLQDEVNHLRNLLQLHRPYSSKESRGSGPLVPISPTPSSSSFYLTTPPCSPRIPPGTKPYKPKDSADQIKDDNNIEGVTLGSSESFTDDILDDIADVGPVLSPPMSVNVLTPHSSTDDSEMELCDRADLQSGASEVENDLSH